MLLGVRGPFESQEPTEEDAARAECEVRGFQLEQLPGVSPLELLREAERLEVCSVEELRNECVQQRFPPADRSTLWGEHNKLVEVLMDIYIWKRMDVTSLRKLCQERKLVVTEMSQRPMLFNMLRTAAWREQEYSSLESLRVECEVNDVPFALSMPKESLVSILRVQMIWRELVPKVHMHTQQSQADFLMKVQMWDLMERCRKDVLDAYQLACQLRVPLAFLRRTEERLYHQIEEHLKPSPLFGQWLSAVVPAVRWSGPPLGGDASESQMAAQVRCTLCKPVWDACGIPVDELDPEQALRVTQKWTSLQTAPLSQLQEEYCHYGLPRERRLDKRAYRKRLRWLAVQDELGRKTWRDRGLANDVPVDRLPRIPGSSGDEHLPIIRLARRWDKLRNMDEERVRQECQEQGLPWAATAKRSELREYLCREAVLLELDLDELYLECEEKGVPLDRGPHFWGLSFFSPEQESELRRWLTRWCLVYENKHFWEAKHFPLLPPDEAASLLAWNAELEEMPHAELKSLYVAQGLPRDPSLQRQDMLEHLRQRLVWEVLPIVELRSKCLQMGATARVEREERQGLVLWLLEELRAEETNRICCRKGYRVEDLRSPLDARQLDKLLVRVGSMDQEALEKRCREQDLPIAGPPPRDKLVKRLNKVNTWNFLSQERLLAECQALPSWSGPSERENLLDALKLHECRQDFQRMDIPVDHLASFAKCSQLAKEWEEIGALTARQLKDKVTEKLGQTVSESSVSLIRELLREVALWEKMPRAPLLELCRHCRNTHPGAKGLNTSGPQSVVLKELVSKLWSNVFFEMLEGKPYKLELLSLLAREDIKVDFTKAMKKNWSWWHLRLFVQSEGLFDPDDPKLEALHRKPAANGARPRVSVVVPTYEGRQHFHEQLWHCFENQTEEEKELVVVETWTTKPSPFFAEMKHDPRLVYVDFKVKAEGNPTLGAKRNLCTQLASGTYIAHFDDDDLYAPRYLEVMLQNIGENDVIKLSSWYVFDARAVRFGYVDANTYTNWKLGYGFSFVYKRDVTTHAAYPPINYAEGVEAEDYTFLHRIHKNTQCSIAFHQDDLGLCLHYIHGANCSNNDAHYDVSHGEALMLEVRNLPCFDSFLNKVKQESPGPGTPLKPRVRKQKILFCHRIRGDIEIEVTAGSTADKMADHAEDKFGVKGLEKIRLSLTDEKPTVLMPAAQRVPLDTKRLFVNFQVPRLPAVGRPHREEKQVLVAA